MPWTYFSHNIYVVGLLFSRPWAPLADSWTLDFPTPPCHQDRVVIIVVVVYSPPPRYFKSKSKSNLKSKNKSKKQKQKEDKENRQQGKYVY